jgi:hypothetical protein
MNQTQANPVGLVVVASLLCIATCASRGAEPKFNATITFFGGHKTVVEDLRVVYAWREMPSNAVGLTAYHPRSKVEQGVWLVQTQGGGAQLELVPFERIKSIQFEAVIQQLGVSETYQLRVGQVWLLTREGSRVDCGDSLLPDGLPLMWPRTRKVSFPAVSKDVEVSQPEVSLRGRSKIEGQDSEFVFVFPTPLQESIRTVLERKRNGLPHRIELAP